MNAKSTAAKMGKTGLLGGIGGLVGGGAAMLIEPSIFKDQASMAKYWWATPLGMLILGAIGGGFDKTALAGAGLAGAAVAKGIGNANMAIAIKRNAQPAAPAANPTSGLDTGAMVLPHELQQADTSGLFSGPNFQTGASYYDETGALVFPART